MNDFSLSMMQQKRRALLQREYKEQRDYFLSLALLNKVTMFWTLIQGLVAYKAQLVDTLSANTSTEYAQTFGEAVVERARLDAPRYGGPEKLYLFKEYLNNLIAEGKLTVGDTYGVEPLGSNYDMVVSFLELYGPIDKEIRTYDEVERERRKFKSMPYEERKAYVERQELVEEIKQQVLAKIEKDHTRRYSKDGRLIRKVKGYESVHQRTAQVQQAEQRMQRRMQLLSRGCPRHEIEYYTLRGKGNKLDGDRKILQSVGKWGQYEQHFPEA